MSYPYIEDETGHERSWYYMMICPSDQSEVVDRLIGERKIYIMMSRGPYAEEAKNM